MNCRKVSNLLSAYIDCELPGVEQLQVQHHLRECSCCSEEYEALLATKRMLSRLSMKPPCGDIEERILSALERDQHSGRRIRGLRAWWSVLTEKQRHHVRVTSLCGALCSASVVLAVTRISGTLDRPDPLAGTVLTPAAQMTVRPPAPVPALAPGQLALPGPEFVLAHDSWSDAQPVHPGVSVAPVAPPFYTAPYGPHAPSRGR